MAHDAQSPLINLQADIGRLRNNGGGAYDQFVKSFATYVDEVTVAVTDAPSDQILRVQGHAQMARKMLILFKEAQK
jgi:predicted Zn-dependent protease with MMP-like domain